MDAFQLRQQDDAFLLVGISARDDRGDRFGLARVVRQVRNISRDIKEISRLHDRVMLKAFAVPHVRDAAQRVDRSLVGRVLVRKRAPAGRNGEKLHMDRFRACRLGRNAHGVLQALFADERVSWPKLFANGNRLLHCGIKPRFQV